MTVAYPYRSQWKYIWALTAIVTTLGIVAAYMGSRNYLAAIMFDATVLLTWFQRPWKN